MPTLPPDNRTPQATDVSALLAELVASHVRLERRFARLERLFDTFAGVFLNAKFPFGKPSDRWSRR